MGKIQIGYFGNDWYIFVDTSKNLVFMSRSSSNVSESHVNPTYELFSSIVESDDDLESIFYGLLCQVPYDYDRLKVQRAKVNTLFYNKNSGLEIQKTIDLLFQNFKNENHNYKLEIYRILNIVAESLPDGFFKRLGDKIG
jgi:hypothetical protein